MKADHKPFNREVKLNAVLESTNDSIILLSRHCRVLLFSRVTEQHFRRLYKRPIREGDDIGAFLLPGMEKDFYANFRKALKGEAVVVKRELPFPSGKKVWFRMRYLPVHDEAGQLIGVSFTATNIDRQQRQLEHLRKIASTHSHEIRRPVASLIGIASLMEEGDFDADNQKWIRYIKLLALELDGIIHRIVDKASAA